MKYSIARAQLVITLTVGLMLSLAPSVHAEDNECSLARAAGKWSFTDNGTLIGIGLRVAVGTLTLDSAGNVSNGTVTSNLNGTITSETASGLRGQVKTGRRRSGQNRPTEVAGD